MDIIKRIERAILAFQIFCLDITIEGQTEALSCLGDPMLKGRIEIARSNARSERASLRAQYSATFPPGHMIRWKAA